VGLGVRVDPYASSSFHVEIDGLLIGGFSEVSGLEVETDVLDYAEGGLNDRVHNLPGQSRQAGNIVLRRGMTDSDTLFRWHADTVAGNVDRRNGAILLLEGWLEAWRWDFLRGYPVRWTGPDLRAGADGVAIEELEIAHDGISSPRRIVSEARAASLARRALRAGGAGV
jgi:phage tail-like protein